jgi:hypothetical protein
MLHLFYTSYFSKLLGDQCPSCEGGIPVMRNWFLEEFLLAIRTSCPYKGCDKDLNLHEGEEHLRACEYKQMGLRETIGGSLGVPSQRSS